MFTSSHFISQTHAKCLLGAGHSAAFWVLHAKQKWSHCLGRKTIKNLPKGAERAHALHACGIGSTPGSIACMGHGFNSWQQNPEQTSTKSQLQCDRCYRGKAHVIMQAYNTWHFVLLCCSLIALHIYVCLTCPEFSPQHYIKLGTVTHVWFQYSGIEAEGLKNLGTS